MTNQTTHNPAEQQAEASIKERIGDFLSGYARSNPQNLKEFANDAGWAAHAQKELENRRLSFLKLLGNEELAAIANGEIDFAAMAKAASV